MDPSSAPKTLRDRLNKSKHDYQGNHETFDMPDSLKPEEPTSSIPFSKIGGIFVIIVVLTGIALVVLSILTDSSSFL